MERRPFARRAPFRGGSRRARSPATPVVLLLGRRVDERFSGPKTPPNDFCNDDLPVSGQGPVPSFGNEVDTRARLVERSILARAFGRSRRRVAAFPRSPGEAAASHVIHRGESGIVPKDVPIARAPRSTLRWDGRAWVRRPERRTIERRRWLPSSSASSAPVSPIREVEGGGDQPRRSRTGLRPPSNAAPRRATLSERSRHLSPSRNPRGSGDGSPAPVWTSAPSRRPFLQDRALLRNAAPL